MQEEIKSLRLEVKSLSDTGEFTGIASTYGNVDLGGDIMEPGAFTKTIAERGAKVRLKDNHEIRIGIASVRDTPEGLAVDGKINLDKQAGKDAYSDLKFYDDQGLPMGMSIGYQTVKSDKDTKGFRHLKEVRIFEVTVTEMPMNEKAQVLSVKSMAGLIESVKANRLEKKDDFLAELQEIQVYAARYQMLQALSGALCDALYDPDVPDRVAASRDSIQQFSDAYLTMLPDYLSLMTGDGIDMEWMSKRVPELKEGRMLSASNRSAIEDCIKALQSVLSAADKSLSTSESGAAVSTPESKAATSAPEPVNHSAIITEMKGLLQWTPSNSN